jgi:tetratricopeptide (TPR) repeat protein
VLGADPAQYGALAVIGDSQLELGRYEDAADAYARLSKALPDTAAVLARRARLVWLHGDAENALNLARSATRLASRSGVFGAELAWYRAFEARILLDSGRYRAAERSYRVALRSAPRYHLAVAGLARSLAAQGRFDRAIRWYERAVSIVPEPDYLAALGDLYELTGLTDRAQAQYDTVGVIATLADVNRQVFNRQLALFYADHDMHPRTALRLAARELEVRRDINGYDVYAWALYRNGRFKAARRASDRALALNTPDSRLLFHSGMISAALGLDGRARSELSRALAINPRFDPLQAPIAREVLASIGDSR